MYQTRKEYANSANMSRVSPAGLLRVPVSDALAGRPLDVLVELAEVVACGR